MAIQKVYGRGGKTIEVNALSARTLSPAAAADEVGIPEATVVQLRDQGKIVRTAPNEEPPGVICWTYKDEKGKMQVGIAAKSG